MTQNPKQKPFAFFDRIEVKPTNGVASVISSSANTIGAEDRAFHDWYRFVLSYPPHLVRDYLKDFDLERNAVVLDPFCGTGTTLVESKLNHFQAVGLEANPFPHFASSVKTSWETAPEVLSDLSQQVAEVTLERLLADGIDDMSLTVDSAAALRSLPADAERALIKNSISPLPLHKTLVLLDEINRFRGHPAHKYCLLALGNALVTSIGNLRFGPEVGVGKIKQDVHVIAAWTEEVRRMAADLQLTYGDDYPLAQVHLADARDASSVLAPHSVDAVITSPPYPNEKDYTRTTRLESVLLGYFEDMLHLRSYKKTLLRSNTRGVYKADDDDSWVEHHAGIQEIADQIEARRIELGKTSGFEKLYARVTKLYFGGMARHLSELKPILRPNARLAYVVGDQASYLRIMIRTGQLLAEIAEDVGYEVERIDLFRTRFATATQCDLREEVVVLRWPGD